MCNEPGDPLLDRVIRCVEDILALQRGMIGIETRAADVESWDSFGHVRIVLALEAEFGVGFTIAEIEASDAVARLVQIVEAAQARGTGPAPMHQ